MNIECVVSDCLVLYTEDKSSKDKSGKNKDINWCELVFMQGSNVNTVTVAPEVKKDLIVGTKYDLIFTVTEQTKATNNVAYKVNKFKCTGYYEPIPDKD